MRKLLAASALLISASASAQAPSKPAKPSFAIAALVYTNCVKLMSREWAHTGEGADVIAEGALGKCAEMEGPLRDGFTAYMMAEGVGGRAVAEWPKVWASLRADTKRQGIAAVLEARAKPVK